MNMLKEARNVQDFARIAQIWSAILDITVSAEQVGLCMIGVKISRETHQHKSDNLVDIAGYAQTLAMVHEWFDGLSED